MKVNVFWFRRDLRLNDNRGLFEALKSEYPVLPLFIFDRNILDDLEADDARVTFIHNQLSGMREQLSALDKGFWVEHGSPEAVWENLLQEFDVQAVFCNHDYEPYAQKREQMVIKLLKGKGAVLHTFKDQVIFEKEEILSGAGKPYTVYTPYSKKWKESLRQSHLTYYNCEALWDNFLPKSQVPRSFPSLGQMNFKVSSQIFPSDSPKEQTIRVYDQYRNFPAQPGTTRIGIHLRFGTISIRQLAKKAIELNEVYLKELIWREFYMQILWNFPHVVEGPFRKQYERVPWVHDEEAFEKWKQGKTGFPIVDAGMRELNETGYMHNRVRMITASFLVKDLLINWQWGESYFAEKLLDFELSSNNGGWQWAAGSGTDAAPYFRIFNPESQMKKFDPKLVYVRKWVPEFGTPLYPAPMVNHKTARENTLKVYKEALGN
ncbi:MAG: deoxyribodipyrimidine photo-lyase [Bacteroidota bacterium]